MNKNIHILIVDDDVNFHLLVKRLLKERPYVITTARKGDDGFRLAQHIHPDIMIVDVIMEGMNGLELCRKIKDDANLKDVYVVLVSGQNTTASDRLQGLESLADDYLTKPIENAELLIRVEYFIRLKKSQDQLIATNRSIEHRISIKTDELSKTNSFLLESEKLLREREEQLNNLITSATDAIIDLDNNHRIILFNRAAEKMFACRAKDVVGDHIDSILPLSAIDEYIQHSLRQTSPAEWGHNSSHPEIFHVKRNDGEAMILEVSFSQYFVKHIPHSTIFMRDITKRVKSEEMLMLLGHSIRSVTQGVTITDLTNNLLFVNPAFLSMYGYSEEEVLGRHIKFLFADPDFDDSAVIKSTIEKRWQGELFNRRKNGEIFPIFLTTSAVLNDLNQPIALVGIITDITEKKSAEEKIVRSERHYRDLVENINQGYYIADHRSIFTYCNPSISLVTGWRHEELLQTSSFRLVAPEDRKRVIKQYQLWAKNKETDVIIEFEVITKNTSRITIEQLTNIVRDQHGNIIEFRCFLSDITKRKNAEQLLKSSEERFRNLFDHSTIGIYRTTPDGEIIIANKALITMLGFDSLEDLKQRNLENSGYSDRRKREEFKSLFLKSNSINGFESQWVTKSGESIYVSEGATVVRNDDGTVLYYDGTVENITERVKTLSELKKSESTFRTYMMNAPIGIGIINTQGEIIEVNKALEKIMKVNRFTLIRKNIFEYLAPEFISNARSLHIQLQKQKLIKEEVALRIANGASLWTAISAVSILPDKYLCFIEDISDRIQRIEEIKQMNDTLEQKIAERTLQLAETISELESFSYSISHDLRAPVRAIDSFASILANEEGQNLGKEASHLLDMIRLNTSRMGRMIDDLLQFSRTSRAEIKKVQFDIQSLAEIVMDEALFGEKHRKFDTLIHPLPPAFGDPSLLRQVLVNLVSNAVKFSRIREVSRIEIGGTMVDKQCQYFVKDNGPGFDMRYADKLFEVFHRLHSQSEFEGTGVGLAIVNKIIQKHAGKIWVESVLNVGTTFYFSIPIASE